MNELTSRREEVLPGVKWGHADEILSPAFWAAVGATATDAHGFVHQKGSLRREICFCLLGGFGIKAEVNRAAFSRLSKVGIFKVGRRPNSREIERLLRIPLCVDGRKIRYRFPHQRAQRISAALKLLENDVPPKSDALELRRWLMKIPGIGLKTASWIVRNHLGSDTVAILDVHVVRACQLMNLFGPSVSLPRDYPALEKKFLDFAHAIGIKPSLLDAIMWREMRSLSFVFKESKNKSFGK
jgi:thermostable 8-oxoguanine DNA glycosylase